MKNAQQGVLGYIFMIMFFLIVMGLIGSQVFGLYDLAATFGNLSGVSLFIMKNFPVWITLGVIFGVVLFYYRLRGG